MTDGQRGKRFMDWGIVEVKITSPTVEEAAALPQAPDGMSEAEMVREVIDRTFKPKVPAAGDLSTAARLARDLAFIEEQGGTLLIPPEISGE